MSARITATLRPARGPQYRRPGGPWDLPTLIDLLRAGPPRHDALVDGDLRWSTTEVFDHVQGVAGALRRAGVRRSDVVAWQLPNGHEAALLPLACWLLGAIAAPIHERAGTAEVDAIVGRLEPAVVLAAPHLPLAEADGAVVLGGAALPARGRAGTAGHHGGRSLLAWSADADPVTESAARPSDIAAVLFTAGSSGAPKGVIHTHRTLGYKARLMPAVHGLTAADAVLMPAPLAHVSGLLNGLLVPFVAGMGIVLMPKWNPSVALETIERERITFMVGPPTFFLGLMGAPDFSARKVRSLRLVSCGGAGVTESFARDAAHRLGATVKRTYGSTEVPTVATSSATDPPERAWTTDGHPVGEAEVRIVHPESGRDLPIGVVGELWVRGPEAFVGYLEDEATQASVARGGWFRTGDLASIDGEGWLTISGRLKDTIIRGGENIAAAAVEAVAEAHPAVRHAVAVGEPDERLGERVALVVEADARFDLEACRAWFAERGVAKLSWPERVIVVDAIPVLAAGKPDRAAVRARLAANRT